MNTTTTTTTTKTPKTGERYTTTRRDLIHGHLTFHVVITGGYNRTVFATQVGIETPDGAIKPCAVALEIDARRFDAGDFAASVSK